MRKTCSRLAAQSRRKKESQLFKELASLLPLDLSMDGQRDKASVIRLTIAYLHLRGVLDTPGSLMKPPSPGVSAKSHERELLDSALGGFVVLLSLNGKVIFTTKGLTTHTGINQMDMIGRSLLEFLHPCDQMEVKDILTRLIGKQGPQKCEVFLRIKKAMNQKLTGWKIIQCSGKKRSSATPGSSCLVLECRVLPIQEITEVDEALSTCTFISIHSPDMTFTYCHSRVMKLIGFRDTDLLGQSVYQYYHPSDCQQIRKAHTCLLSKGQVSTGKYRLLHRYGGYVWAETDASLVCNSQTGVPESVVCINYILSGVEQPTLEFLLEKTELLLKPTSGSYCPESEPHPFPPSRGQDSEKDLKESNEHNSSTTLLKQRDGDIQEVECTEIPHNTEGCYDFNCDQCELDLDSLAPYIPMHGEDFLLTPILDRTMDMPEFNTRRPSFNSPCQNLDSSEGTTFLPLKSLNPTQQRISDTNLISTKQWNDGLDLVNKNSKVYDYDYKQHNYQLFSMETKARHWMEDALKFSQQPNRVHINIDGSSTPQICGGHLNHLEAKFRSLQEKSKCPSQNRRHQNEVKAAPAPVTLPVLSGWECEVNAPLEHTSYLLQGTEIMAVLDQVASRVPWC